MRPTHVPSHESRDRSHQLRRQAVQVLWPPRVIAELNHYQFRSLAGRALPAQARQQASHLPRSILIPILPHHVDLPVHRVLT